MLGNATLGLLGQTEEAEISSYKGGYEGLKARDAQEKAIKVEELRNKLADFASGDIMLSPEDINLLPSQEIGAEERFLKSLAPYEKEGGYKKFEEDLDTIKKIEEDIQKKNLQRSLEREKEMYKSLEGVEPISAFAAASGGLANLTNNNTPQKRT
jgi:hypothetical protein